ncbi:MAG: hypothetical protein Kow00129_08880 [Thermoleophilia bacterium]
MQERLRVTEDGWSSGELLTLPREGSGRSARCWSASLRELPREAAESLDTQVCLDPEDAESWRLTVRYRGELVLDARYPSYPDAADAVMSIFDILLDEEPGPV